MLSDESCSATYRIDIEVHKSGWRDPFIKWRGLCSRVLAFGCIGYLKVSQIQHHESLQDKMFMADGPVTVRREQSSEATACFSDFRSASAGLSLNPTRRML